MIICYTNALSYSVVLHYELPLLPRGPLDRETVLDLDLESDLNGSLGDCLGSYV